MKVLLVRFSSIGDIVLTSPVVRCLHEQCPGIEIHYLTKEAYVSLVKFDPRIQKVHSIKKHISEVIKELEAEKFDRIIDLHHNLRSWQVIRELGVPASSFPKLNVEKWLLVNLGIDRLPDQHIVERYLKTTEGLGVKNDDGGLELHLGDSAGPLINKAGLSLPASFVAVVCGAKFGTKQMPAEKLVQILQKVTLPLVLLGGPEDKIRAEAITAGLTSHSVINLVGKTDLLTSAAVISLAHKVLTHDTGMMHIASAFKRNIISLWGNTIPQFGMYPYRTGYGEKGAGSMFEVKGLKCRPCSKLGYETCPKGHFKCMNDQDIPSIINALNN